MAMIPTNPRYPQHLNIGQYVRVAEWVGQVVDIAVSELDRVMVLVQSPKMTWRNGGVEWLEYKYSQPSLIQPATQQDYLAEVELYLRRCQDTTGKISMLLIHHHVKTP